MPVGLVRERTYTIFRHFPDRIGLVPICCGIQREGEDIPSFDGPGRTEYGNWVDAKDFLRALRKETPSSESTEASEKLWLGHVEGCCYASPEGWKCQPDCTAFDAHVETR